MAKTTLAIYFFTLNKTNFQFDMGDISNGVSFSECCYDYFQNFMQKYKNLSSQERVFKTMRAEFAIAKLNNRTLYTSLHCTLKSGAYGVEAELVDSNTGTFNYMKERSHAEVMPFTFSIYSVPNSDTGILIVQSYGQYGITTLLKKELQEFIHLSIDKDIKLIFTNMAARQHFQYLFTSETVKEIALVKYNDNNSDKTNRITGRRFNSEKVSEVYSNPLPLERSLISKILNGFSNRNDVNEILGIQEGTFDDMSFVFTPKNSSQSQTTVRYSNFNNMRISFDVSSKVSIDGQHPEYTKLVPEMNVLSEQYMQNSGILRRLPINHESIQYQTIKKEYEILNDNNKE